MARSLSQSKRLVSDAVCLALQRRGYSVSVSLSSSSSSSSRVGKLEDASASAITITQTQASSSSSSAWVPDPVTGYYRPIDRSSDIDPADLRHMLLNHNLRSPPPSS